MAPLSGRERRKRCGNIWTATLLDGYLQRQCLPLCGLQHSIRTLPLRDRLYAFCFLTKVFTTGHLLPAEDNSAHLSVLDVLEL
jgi:hypothetical protein